jgi:transposase InsO family protein
VRELSEKTELRQARIIRWVGIARGKFFDWKKRYGKANEHNAWVPRDHWIEEWERQAIIEFHHQHPLEGYRRLAFMLIDSDKVFVSPSTVYRVLAQAGVLSKWKNGPTRKGFGFEQPTKPHQHWHVDISYLNIGGTFFYLTLVLDGASRAVVHFEIRESMTEQDVELVLEKAREKYPGVKPRLISDNGPQFIARDFKSYIRLTGMSHVKTSRAYPQSNGKIERFFGTLKSDAIRPACPRTRKEAECVVTRFVEHYNGVRLHSAIGYVTPNDVLEDRVAEIHERRDRKLAQAREQRAARRAAERSAA